ncbi:hypothetical protein SAMN04488121_11231 [Chitinophaga filiformis]|uniref:Uncharacterized protein n=1 Tax=Chitinophaga filiformis TaxID=104663 RepID=A0A1G8C6D2_CHIFI|nr:hypothetical protein SAMN04488121_11231 [Chitinophaga filiformis]
MITYTYEKAELKQKTGSGGTLPVKALLRY